MIFQDNVKVLSFVPFCVYECEINIRIALFRVKARHGLRILGAEPSKPDSWRVTVEMNHKRRSAVVTASVQDQTTYTKTDR